MIRAKIGMIFQKPTPFPMSIYDNIAFGGVIGPIRKAVTGSAMDERVEWALRRRRCGDEVKESCSRSATQAFRGGQQQNGVHCAALL